MGRCKGVMRMGAREVWGHARSLAKWGRQRVSDFCICGKRGNPGSYWRRSKLKGKERCFIFVVFFFCAVK